MSERCLRTDTLGAYLLGGLDEREGLAMRAHLDGCGSCSAEMADLKPVAHLLQTVDVRRVLDIGEPSPALAAAVFSSVRRVERRHRWVKAGALLTVAAALLVGLALVRTGDGGPKIVAQRVQLIGTSGVNAWVDVRSVPAGTYAVFHTNGLPAPAVYRMWFEDEAGGRVALGTFRGALGAWLACPTTTALSVSDLAAVGISDENGVTVLRAALGAATGVRAGFGPTTGVPGADYVP